jgi:glycosyltransferase involved in cell wall biosynthesis
MAPRIALGLPVYNGERFLREAIDSILCQTYTDFELIICDNASTDRTPAICLEYQSRDSRVRYVRNDTNIGPAANFNRTFHLAHGEYFKWVAADDVCEPDFLRVCVAALDADPGAAMAFTGTRIIDDRGDTVGHDTYVLSTDSSTPQARFRALLLANHRRHGAFEAFGLYRASMLGDTPLFECYCRGDSVLFARVALRGRFIRLGRELFLNRDHRGRSERVKPSRIACGSFFARWLGSGPTPPAEWWDASKRGRVVFPEWNLAWKYLRSIGAAPLTLRQRTACYGWWIYFTLRTSHKLARDLVLAIEHPVFLFFQYVRSPEQTEHHRVATSARSLASIINWRKAR